MTSKVRYDIRIERLRDAEYYLAFCPQLPQFSAHSDNLGELRERITRGMERTLMRQGDRAPTVTLEPEAPAEPSTAFVLPSAAVAHYAAA